MDSVRTVEIELSNSTHSAALVCFSGGQDSTTSLAWALDRYERVETVGFEYGQKHIVEMDSRPKVRQAIVELVPAWRNRLGPDRVIALDLVGQLGGAKIESPPHHPMNSEGFSSGRRYIPGRNLLMLSMCASIAFRRDINILVCGTSETEYSGYPDCRDASMRAINAAINTSTGLEFNIECPLMWLDKSGVWALAEKLGGDGLVELIAEETHTCYLGDRNRRYEWGYGCGSCPACELRANGWNKFKSANRNRYSSLLD